jgi:hypothetical protein
MKFRRLRHYSLLLLVVLVVVSQPFEVQAAVRLQGQQTLQECSEVDEATLQDELNRVTQAIFARTLDEVDLSAIVDTQWARLGLDALIDAEVDRAVERVRNEKALWDTFLSGWSADKAEELTRAVATYAFESEAFALAIEELSAAVADKLAQQIAILSAESVSAAFYCLQTFIADNYAGVLVRKFEQQVQAAAEAADLEKAVEVDNSILSVLDQHKGLLGGVGVIARRVVANMGRQIARRVAGRIVGRVLGRIGTEIIPIVGWLIGTGLIAYDLYSSREGALPQIQADLKSAEVKAGIRSEIVAAMEPEFRRESPQIARDVANDLFGQWREVRRNIRNVLALAEADPAFRILLEGLQNTDELARLVALVGVAQPALGTEAFNQAVADGSLTRLLQQPASALTILEQTKSVETTLAWSALERDLLDAVVRFELYKQLTPDRLSRPLLEQLLALNDQVAIEKVALLDPADVEMLLTISTNHLTALTGYLLPEDLRVLAGYLRQMNQEQKNRLISRLVSNPALFRVLDSEPVQRQLVASGNVDAALDFLQSPPGLDTVTGDLSALLTGQVGGRLFLYKYGAGQSALMGIGGVILLLILLRLLYGLVFWLAIPVRGPFRRS